jgi:tripartite-type tricarboxylate transporter receptor subunit TctC
MPKPIVAKIHDAFRKAMEDPEYKSIMKKFDMNDYYLNTEDYAKYMKSDYENIETLVKKLGLDKK